MEFNIYGHLEVRKRDLGARWEHELLIAGSLVLVLFFILFRVRGGMDSHDLVWKNKVSLPTDVTFDTWIDANIPDTNNIFCTCMSNLEILTMVVGMRLSHIMKKNKVYDEYHDFFTKITDLSKKVEMRLIFITILE